LVGRAKSPPSGQGDAAEVPTPPTAITRATSSDGRLVVELVDPAGDVELLGRIMATLPPGRGAVLDSWSGDDHVVVRLLDALADELRAVGRRRVTRTCGASEVEQASRLARAGFALLRSEGEVATWVLDL
jgi:hypothetical protein